VSRGRSAGGTGSTAVSHTGADTGGAIAAPIFKRIADSALRHLGVTPTINPAPPVMIARNQETPVMPAASVGTPNVVAMPANTPLIALATELGKTAITGASVIALQAAEQFVLYTGVRPSAEQIQRASEYSRA